MKVAYLAGATDFHAMDWLKSCLKANPEKNVYLLTDLIKSQGFESFSDDRLSVINLVVLDKLLLRNQSFIAHKWRNLLKFLVLPIQALIVYRFSKKYPNLIFHAHSMYYLVVARMAGVKYIGTPVGSDILIKPFTSKLFYIFANYGIKNAIHITVDSNAMLELLISKFDYKRGVSVIQNGIDFETISNCKFDKIKESNVNYIYSIRGLAPIYQTEELFLARNQTIPQIPIFFSYPFSEVDYVKKINELYSPNDIDLGKISKIEMYEKMNQSLLVVSIPYSDSSPRSVYEAIFCGAIVAVTNSKYLEQLPICMLDRLIIIDLNDTNWLSEACNKALKLRSIPFKPSEEAILMFDQYNSYKTLEKIYAKFIV
jgi:glycosyltransferase involved in cell wall biosynthesis